MHTALTALIIHPDPERSAQYRRFLRLDAQVSWDVRVADSLAIAQILWQTHRPQVVLLPHHLLVETEAIADWLAQAPAPVVVLLPADAEALAPQLLQQGAADYLLEPGLTPVRLRCTLQLAQQRAASHLKQALQENEARWQLVLAGTNDGIWDWNIRTNQVFRSDRWAQMLGYSPETFSPSQLAWADLIHPDDRPSVLAAQRAYLNGDAPRYQAEFRMRCQDGSYRWILSRGQAVWDEAGRPLRIAGSHTDIHALKQAEQALKNLNEALEQRVQTRTEALLHSQAQLQHQTKLLQAILDSMGDGVLVADTQGQILLQNPAAAEILGLSQDDCQTPPLQTMWGLYLPSGPPCTTDDLPLVQAMQGQSVEQAEILLRNIHYPEGRAIESTARPLLDTAGNIQGGVVVLRDVTARKRAEAALQDSEYRLNQAQELAHLGSWEWHLPTQAMAWSDEIYRIFGYAPQAFAPTYDAFLEQVHPVDRATVHAAVEHSLAGDTVFNVDHRVLRADGAVRCVHSQADIQFNDQGHPLRLVGTLQDITDRKQAEEETQILATLVSNSDDFIGVAGLDGAALYLNPAGRALVGLPETVPVTETSMYDYFAPDHREIFQHQIVPIVQREGIWQGEFFLRHFQTGQVIPLEFNLFLIYAPGTTTPFAIAGVLRDIRDRKAAEQAIRRSEERLRAALLASETGTFRWNIRDHSLNWDDNLNRLFGLLPGEVVDTLDEFIDRVHPDDRAAVIAACDRCLQTGVDFEQEFRVVWPDGSVHWIFDKGRTFFAPDGTPDYMTGACVDVTERKQAEAALRQMNLELERRVEARTAELRDAKDAAEAASRAKSTFLANMSHELRTPLNAILGFSQLMERDATLSARHLETISIINRSGEHLLMLLNDILEMSKIEAGRASLSPQEFDLMPLLNTLADMLRLEAETKGLNFQVVCAPEVPRHLYADESKLRQVLINLLSNAIKFTQVGQVTLRVSRMEHASTAAPTEWLHFAVEDTGIGIAAADRALIFEPFRQAHTGSATQGGTGLGLAISREFIHLMGGELTLESTLGVGSVFAFTLPVQPVAAAAIALPTLHRRPIAIAPGQPTYRVLVAEDNTANRQLMQRLLIPLGFVVETVADGRAALARWQQWQPHLIYMDIRMPVMDGCEATRQIRTQEQARGDRPATVILALTAGAFEEDTPQVLAAGCDHCLHKPLRETVLIDSLVSYLGVKFCYDSPGNAADSVPADPQRLAAPEPRSLSADALKCMPTPWIEQFCQATAAINVEQMTQLLADIPPTEAALAEALQASIDSFDFEVLLALAQTAKT